MARKSSKEKTEIKTAKVDKATKKEHKKKT